MANENKPDEQKLDEEETKDEQTEEETSEETDEPKADESKADEQEDEVKDKHGQPGINREKYARDIEERDKQIAELKAQVEELTKTEEGRQEALRRVDELEQSLADDRLNFDLERAGCRNNKAAKALLEDYEGDVQKLKESEPWLFMEERKGATGLKPTTAGASEAEEAKVDNALGLKKG